MPRLDHLALAAADLDAGVAMIEELTGVRAVPGGPHPGVGTRNALLAFDDETYFEIIGIDPAQVEPVEPRPFGIDDGAGPRLAGYAVHPGPGETLDDVVRLLRTAGHDPGPVVPMSRLRPDGERLTWHLTRIDARAPAPIPFAIDWGETPNPARSLPRLGRLAELRIVHPDPLVRGTLRSLRLGLTIAEGPAQLVAVVESPRGTVEIA